MRYFTTLIFICLIIVGCAPANVRKQMHTASACQNEWQYFKVTQPISGKVLAHHPGWCRGNSKMAAATTVITTTGDTIRVLELCNKTKFNYMDMVAVMPADEPVQKRAALDINLDCKIKRTCYGYLSLIKK